MEEKLDMLKKVGLLKYKDKPIKAYLFIIIVFALIIIPTIYSYFIYKTGK